MDLTARQIKLLQIIIETYAISALPVSSEDIKQKNMTDLSSATIRNEMLALEKVGFLEKTHTSSGRIPAIAGYKFYQQNILQPKINTDIKHKLEKIFANRELSIDTVIDQSVQIINESFKLPLLISKEENESLKRFDLIRLNEHHALIIVVSSSGKINKNIIEINSDIQFDDIAICIRVFNDRLIDTPIMQVTEKLNSIKQIIKMAVQQYEFCIRQVVERIFDLKIISTNTKVTGTKYLTSQPEFQDLKKLNEVLTFLEDTNVWKHIAYIHNRTGATTIAFGEDIGNKNIALASTSINVGNNIQRQLTIVGPTRMEYDKVQGVLDFIKTELEKMHEN